jgi:hypothetical protein
LTGAGPVGSGSGDCRPLDFVARGRFRSLSQAIPVGAWPVALADTANTSFTPKASMVVVNSDRSGSTNGG